MEQDGMNLLQEITKSRFLMLLLEEKQYEMELKDIVKNIGETKTKICYVCLSKPYKDVIEDLKRMGVNTKNFFFIDILSSHYLKPKPVKNCIFLEAPPELVSIRLAIEKVIMEKKCSVIIFDTISSLLIYQESYSIVRFTHEIMTDKMQEKTKKIYIVLKGSGLPGGENQGMIKDLCMFADTTVDMTEKPD